MKVQKLKDGEGLYLVVHPNGSKYWRLRFTYAGKEKMEGIGKYPQVSLIQARERKRESQRLIADGINPIIHKKQYKAGGDNSLAAVARDWHDKNKHKWTPKHGQKVLRRLELHIFPALGDIPVNKIKPLELLHELRKIEDADRQDVPHRVLQITSNVFKYAIITQKAEYNPAQDLSGALKPYIKKNYKSIKPEELGSFIKEINKVSVKEEIRLLAKILLLTFLRQGELRHAKWEDIDWKKCIMLVPGENMKMKIDHIVPLAEETLVLLKRLKKITGDSEYLFPNTQRQKHPVISENAVNNLIKLTKFSGKIVAHGFRALASTVLNDNGFRADVIEKQLAHKEKNEVRAAYNRAQYMPERIQMMKWWAEYVSTSGKL